MYFLLSVTLLQKLGEGCSGISIRASTLGIVTRIWSRHLQNVVQSVEGTKDFSLLQSNQTAADAQPVTHSRDTGGSSPAGTAVWV